MTHLGWHFVRADRKLGFRDGNTVAPGSVYEIDPDAGKEPFGLCQWGLHWSKRPLDAFTYAPGPIVCRVKASGKTIHGDDKSVSTKREVLWMADTTDTLREFARLCALDVVHLWDPPQVVLDYLKTGDESLRAAAIDAASAAERDAARNAARAAARNAAWDATRNAAWAAAWAAARDAAGDAARNAAGDAAWAAAWDAAWASAWDAAWDAARKKQNTRLTKMLNKLKP